jgi:hypothetical protein
MRNPREGGDATISMLNLLIIQEIAGMMESKMPLNSDAAKEIIESYVKDGKVSDKGVDFIVLAIKDKLPNIEFKEIADNEAGIIPFYMKKIGEKLGMSVQEFRERIRKNLN